MTSVASVGAVTTIGLAPPATGVIRAGDKTGGAAVPASTTVTLGLGASPALTYTPQPASAAVVWERETADKVSSVIADTLPARTLAGRLEGVASALLDRFKTDGGSYSQSARMASGAGQVDGLDGVQAGSAAQAEDAYMLRVTTASGVKVEVSLRNRPDGLAVQIDVAEGELSETERKAISGLSKAFQDAVDGLASVPPRMAWSSLAKFDSSVLSSVSMQATATANGAVAQSVDFSADSKQRSLTIKNAEGVVKVDVDVSKAALFGNAQQRAAAVSDYLQQFDAARGRGRGAEALMSLFKDAFAELHQSYEAGAAPSSQAPRIAAAGYTYRSLLSGVADFSASISQTMDASNPYKTSEINQFTYQVSQSSRVSGRPLFDLGIKQEQRANLAASFHTALAPQQKLELSKDKDSQNYKFFQIKDEITSQTGIQYEQGRLIEASFTQTRNLSMRVQAYVKGELIEDTLTPVIETRTRDLLTLVRSADLEPSEIERLQRRDPAAADAMLLGKHLALSRAVARERQD
jgi:hypothetical protein